MPKIIIHSLGTVATHRRERTRLIESKWFCGGMALALVSLLKWGIAAIMSLNSF